MAISTPPTSLGTLNDGSSSTTLVLTTTATAPSGAKIWLVAMYFQTVSVAMSVSSVSGGGLTWWIDSQGMLANQNGLAIISADAPSGLASSTSITITLSAACVDRKISGFYSTGVQTGNIAYGAVSQNQVSNTAWSSTSTTVSSGDILIGGGTWEDGVVTTSTPSGGNSELDDFGGAGHSITSVYQIGTGASIAAQGTWTNTSNGGVGCRSAAVAYPVAAATATPPLPTVVDTAVDRAANY